MKKYIGLSIMALVLGLSSCDDYLDKNPDNRASIVDEEDITSILVSAYPTAHYAYIAETYSDNIVKETNPTYTSYQKIEDEAFRWRDITWYDPDGDCPFALWEKCYEAIGSANLALEAIEKSPEKENLQGQKGEALMCRAYAHWILASVFCHAYSQTHASTDLGIPYITVPQKSYDEFYPRGTLAETYAAIDKDIQEALPIMNDNHITVKKYHFTRKAALAFASRFYLYYVQPDFSNYDKVIDYATEVLGENPTLVLRDWNTVGNRDINGQVRARAYGDEEDPANLLLISTQSAWTVCYGPFGAGYKYCHNTFVADNLSCAATPWGDRGSFYFRIPRYTGMPKVIMAKNAYLFEYTDAVNGIGFAHMMYNALTTDEVLVNRAEAYTMKNQLDEAAADLNLWGSTFYSTRRNRTAQQIIDFYSDLPYYDLSGDNEVVSPKKRIHVDYNIGSDDQESMLQATIAVRRILSLHEGNRLFDVKRFGLEMDRFSVNGNDIVDKIDHAANDLAGERDPRLAVQLPQQIINAGLERNPR